MVNRGEGDTAARTFDLGLGVSYRVDFGRRVVTTFFADGLETSAWREVTSESRQEAADQGYGSDAEAVWRSLVEHELFHTLLARNLYGRESLALRQAAGGGRELYAQVLHEESVVIACQRWLNTGEVAPWIADRILDLGSICILGRALIEKEDGPKTALPDVLSEIAEARIRLRRPPR